MSALTIIEVNDRLTLRQVAMADATHIWKSVDENRNYLRKYLDWVDHNNSLKDTEQFIERCNQAVHDQKGMTFGIWENDILIGSINFYDLRLDLKKANIGYWIAKTNSKKGIITECARVLINYLFQVLQLNKIEIHFMPENKGSMRIAEKLGFKVEGVLRQSLFHQGNAKDLVITGLLRNEWKN